MQSYEVEIKSLLGGVESAEEIRRAMKKADASCKLESKNKQLNHYFEKGDLEKLSKVVAPRLSREAQRKLSDLTTRAKGFSVRTRDKDSAVYLVIKVSVDDTTSENGIARMEFEEKVPMTLDELDKFVLSAGF